MSAYLDRPARDEAEYLAAIRYRLISATRDLWRHGMIGASERADIEARIQTAERIHAARG